MGIVSTLDGVVSGLPSLEERLDARSVALIERRRTSFVAARGRGWLVHRALMTADAVGLVLAFLVALVLHGGEAGGADRVSDTVEVLAFLATIPFWIIGASLYDLYRRDEERADYSTVDDLLRVFHLVTVGTWLFFVVTELAGVVNPSVPRLLAFWFTATVLVTVGRAIATGRLQAKHGVRPEHGHRRRRQGGSERRSQAQQPSGVRTQRPRLRRC